MVNENLLQMLFQHYYRPLCLNALHYLDDIDESEDVVQDVLVSLWSRMKDGEQIDSPKSYLFTSVRNRCIDILRSPRTRFSHEEITDAMLPGGDDSEFSLEDAVDRSFEEARVWTAVDRLPSRCREILLMSKVQGKKYSEIAAELGISENTVRNQIAKALKSIRAGVKKVIMFLLSL